MAYNEAHEYVDPEDDPASAYRRLFAGVSADPTIEDPAVAMRRAPIESRCRRLAARAFSFDGTEELASLLAGSADVAAP